MFDEPATISDLLIASLIICWPTALLLAWWLRRRWTKKIDRLGESSSDEMLAELDDAYIRQDRLTIRTQTEYLPFVIETIREHIEQGLDDQQVRSLIERIDIQRPDHERRAVFPVESDGVTSDLSMSWVRDAQDRIELEIRAAPSIIRALHQHRKHIPKARPTRSKV